MNPKDIVSLCIEEGILLDAETLGLLSEESEDAETVKLILKNMKRYTSSKIITKKLLEENKKTTKEVFSELPADQQKKLERLKIKLGLEIEISKETVQNSFKKSETNLSSKQNLSQVKRENTLKNNGNLSVKIISKIPQTKKKIQINDFVNILRDRFIKLKSILEERKDLENLVSINKLSNTRKKVSIIGIISEKRTTKNKNLLLEVEDLTGRSRVLINQSNKDLFLQAEDLSLDSVVGFNGFGDREILFANKIVLPDAALIERKKSPVNESVLFISDLHYGSKLFLEDNFSDFIDYVNGKKRPSEENLKYLFITGDVVAGVGIYPNQKKDLKIQDIESQFQGFADILSKIKRNITMIISPGNHDGVRLMEPQPLLDEKYAWPLYNLKNVVLTGNPAYVNIGAKPEKNFEGFDVLSYHGFSYGYYSGNIPSLIPSGMNGPENIMRYLLQNRHLAPAHGSAQAFPSDEDNMTISKIPDFFVSGHSHKCAITYYNNVLLISNSAWEEETEYQKRKGNQPDLCKVPLVNLKTRAIKIMDFE